MGDNKQKRKNMKKFFVCVSIIVIAVCGGFLYDYFVGFGANDSNVKNEGNKYVISWDIVPTATNYDVYLNGRLLDTITTNKFDITEYLVEDGSYGIEIKAMSVDNGETLVHSENYKYEATYKSDFMRKTFFMNGKTYDYNIESLEEYKIFVWYNVLYRNSGVRWFNSCRDINIANVNRVTYQYISEYPEYDGVKPRNVYASKISDNIYRIANLEYYLPTDFTVGVANATSTTAPKLYEYLNDNAISSSYAKEQYTKATVFNQDYIASSESSERTFPIDSNDNKVLVYNTEQLFMVAQYGASPVFHESATVAKTCYENAKTILRQINNSDALTDYEKALNIYRYICMNVSYDHVIYDFMSYTNDYTVQSNGKYSCFYLEGALLDMDNQVAVCDGLSKTFALLCRIEGIEATKVNGTADGGEHAWNKIKIGSSYYMVDTTWGTVSYSSTGGNYEALSHAYFLISEDQMTTHQIEFQVPTAKTQTYDYYSGATVGSHKALITSDADLISLKAYIKSNDITAFEIKLSDAYYNQIISSGTSVAAYVNTKLKDNTATSACIVLDQVLLVQMIKMVS